MVIYKHLAHVTVRIFIHEARDDLLLVTHTGVGTRPSSWGKEGLTKACWAGTSSS